MLLIITQNWGNSLMELLGGYKMELEKRIKNIERKIAKKQREIANLNFELSELLNQRFAKRWNSGYYNRKELLRTGIWQFGQTCKEKWTKMNGFRECCVCKKEFEDLDDLFIVDAIESLPQICRNCLKAIYEDYILKETLYEEEEEDDTL